MKSTALGQFSPAEFERCDAVGAGEGPAPLSLGLVPNAYLEYEIDALTYRALGEYDRGTETLGRIERKVRASISHSPDGSHARSSAGSFGFWS